MWDDAVGWVVALLAIGASAGWIASGQTRTLRRLKLEAELHSELPASAAKELLAREINEATFEYVWLRRTGTLRRMALSLRVAMVGLLALSVLLVGMSFWALQGDEDDENAVRLAGAGVVVLMCVLLLITRAIRRRLSAALAQRAGNDAE